MRKVKKHKANGYGNAFTRLLSYGNAHSQAHCIWDKALMNARMAEWNEERRK